MLNITGQGGMEVLTTFFDANGITWRYQYKNGETWSRTILFYANNVWYKIVWYTNFSTLYYNGLRYPLRFIGTNNTYPEHSELTIEFSYGPDRSFYNLLLLINKLNTPKETVTYKL